MRFHSNATTNLQQRRQLQSSRLSCRAAAGRYGISSTTAWRWKQRQEPHDASCRPHHINYKLHHDECHMLLSMRRSGLSLDDLLDAAQPILPHLRRATLFRLLQRHGLNRLEPKAKKEHGTFKEYPPGFLHIDHFKLPTLNDNGNDTDNTRYCFVAIDRATRLVFLWVYSDKSAHSAHAFLQRCLEFFPFQIEKILTDNGREFTLDGFKNRWGAKLKATTTHPFEHLCQHNNIEHRRTRPYTPKTNGLVERANRLIKDNTVKVHRYGTITEMIRDLKRWNSIYNFCRPHRRIGRITPYQAVCNWHQIQPERFIKEPAQLIQFRYQSDET